MHKSLSKYLWKKTIDLSDYTEPDSHFITLREPNMAEWREVVRVRDSLAAAGDEARQFEGIAVFCDTLATLIVDHDFFDGEGQQKKPLPAKDVAELVGGKMELATHVIGEYVTSLPLLRGNGKK